MEESMLLWSQDFIIFEKKWSGKDYETNWDEKNEVVKNQDYETDI